ncbi:MAG: sulfurtransferase-like selenium metabolism protein YedF [Deltaproteobacteria bacterium]|nr:sulfurtransferase-like selenium metabolism protein YedF [Deltaproteobacteria bacterium]MBW1928294.1 sulfurtransferase-like selenium metabolism protein YedF [Deltaproteobacteria bacterium]MBW2025034.1 sulfurtransferase-like selenium metabolism protein YedF [Deltaproteobacteria bacterium]MBW2124473.1 sulfurtransferase-like selenium metabolism protein YedF [Deltaproteobacteria bacterium]RLB21849.1 MAG: sulfurtransferase-like selenium metabolism protein YedF [Deltaproteobacteria bacterium]
MPIELDCRGLACPGPVLQTKEALEREHPNTIKVTVDNEASKQNVTRFLESQNFEVTVEREGSLYHVIGKNKSGETTPLKGSAALEAGPERKKIMVMVATDRMGYGDDELGHKLLMNFLKTLKEMGEDLWRLVLVNNGVKLSIDGSEALPTLKELAQTGVHILVCGTCLTHFDLLEKKEIGETTNMLDIVTSMQVADKVINI